jgi:hypothetical protein
VFTSLFYIAYAYGKMMKVAALFYLHEINLNTRSFICGGEMIML